MTSTANTPEEYLSSLPQERREVISKLRQAILTNLPEGFTEEMGYGMLAYVVPHSAYPDGYHCNTKQPLPFMSLASQKNYVAVYHMGIYMDDRLMEWFVQEYPKHARGKLDMGKSCIRFKKMDDIPYDLIGELASRITLKEWLSMYEDGLQR